MKDYLILAEVLLSPLAPISWISLLFVLNVYYNLSQRLGEVTRMPPYYRRFLIGAGLVSVGVLGQIIRTAAHIACDPGVEVLLSPVFSLVAFYLPLLIGIAVSVLTAWRYWSWVLIGE
ncbi:MAG: hypothetical protein RML46_05940 [Anaerolineae bacterium]|nr:hypothetical protein [Anaerolineae bacterium]MDW8068433.1 hypothetical protein [Anaerolineae bacterium]